MTKHPSKKNVKFSTLISDYGAYSFRNALAQFIVQCQNPTLCGAQLQAKMTNIQFPFNAVHVYNRIKYTSYDPYIVQGSNISVVDAIHAQPARKNNHDYDVSAQFDTALVNDGSGKGIGVAGELI
jgi:hypothetical protein